MILAKFKTPQHGVTEVNCHHIEPEIRYIRINPHITIPKCFVLIHFNNSTVWEVEAEHFDKAEQTNRNLI